MPSPARGDESPAVGSFEYHPGEDRWDWSPELFTLHGVPATVQPTTELMLEHMVEEDRTAVLNRLRECLGTPGPYSFSYRLVDARGVARQLAFVGNSETDGQGDIRLHGFVVDITEPVRARASEAVRAATENRSAIEQAKGALMLTFGVDEDLAFSLLRGYSMRHNVKLARLAARIMECLAYPAYADLGPGASLLAVLFDLDYDPERFPQPPSGRSHRAEDVGGTVHGQDSRSAPGSVSPGADHDTMPLR
jgi:hypothetical protein